MKKLLILSLLIGMGLMEEETGYTLRVGETCKDVLNFNVYPLQEARKYCSIFRSCVAISAARWPSTLECTEESFSNHNKFIICSSIISTSKPDDCSVRKVTPTPSTTITTTRTATRTTTKAIQTRASTTRAKTTTTSKARTTTTTTTVSTTFAGSDDFSMLIIVIAIVVLILFLVFATGIVVKHRHLRKKDDVDDFLTIENSKSQISVSTDNTLKNNQARIDTATANSGQTIILEEKLGEGSFGIVYKATLNDGAARKTMALKLVKSIDSKGQVDSLKTELEIMNSLKGKPHQNIVGLIDHAQMDGEAIWIMTEYCNLGSLKEYLLRNDKTLMLEANVGKMNSKSLCTWACEVSSGMAFLEKCQIMHGDLAARNVLLSSIHDAHPIAKITDFGMAKSFYIYPDYQEVSGNVPWKWMAYEVIAIDLRLCSLKSDVWSFGVLLWELLSLGKQPYPEFFKADETFLKSLEDGHFLSCPKVLENLQTWSPTSLFDDVSKLCFQIDKSKRGSFSEIEQTIETYLK